MSRYTRTPVTSGFEVQSQLNQNFSDIQAAIDDTLSRVGDQPNQMEDDIDMNSNRIYNLPSAASPTEPVTYGQWRAAGDVVQFTGTSKEEFVATAAQTVFVLTSSFYTPGSNNLSVYVNGVYQSPSSYVETNTTTFTMSAGLDAGDSVVAVINERQVDNSTVPASSVTVTVGGASTNVSAAITRLQPVGSVSALSALTGMVNGDVVDTRGYYAAGDGGHGTYRYDSASAAATDGGVVVSASSGGRWLLQYDFINAAQFGAKGDGTDTTAAMQAALTAASGGFLYIPKPSSKYLCGELTFSANTKIFIEPGTVFESNSTLLTSTKKLFNIGVENCHIVAVGASIEMVKTGFASEHNHGVSIVGASGKIIIEGLESSNTGGDGFYVNSPLADVTLKQCKADNNRRQGLSVVQCKSFEDYGSEFTNTTGTAPSCGVDIEPNSTTDILGPCRFYGTKTSGNDASGFLVFLYNWNATTNYADIIFDKCVSNDNANSSSGSLNKQGGFEIRRISSTTPCRGTIKLIDCISQKDNYGGMRVWDKDINGPRIEIIRPRVIDCNQAADVTSYNRGGIVCYNTSSYTTAPGNVLIDAPFVQQTSGSNMDYAVLISSAADGHDDVVVRDPTPVGSFGASSPVYIASNEKTVSIINALKPSKAFTSNQTFTDGRFMYYVCTNEGAAGTVNFTIPAATVARIGWRFEFRVHEAFQLSIIPDASDRIWPLGTGIGDAFGSNTIGSRVLLEYVAANKILMTEYSGTWT